MLDHDELRELLDAAGFEDMDVDEAIIHEGALEDYAHDWAKESGFPESWLNYFDAESYACDLIMGGDVVELTDYRDDSRSPRYFATEVTDAVWLLNPNG